VKPNLFNLEGGVGKHLQFSSLVKPLYEKYKKKLIIYSGYPEIFNFDEHVADSKNYAYDTFFDNYYQWFQNFDKIFYHDPYKSDWLKGDKHVVKKWSEMYEVEINDVRPSFFINKEREKKLFDIIKNIGNYILLQFTGGQGIIQSGYNKHNFGRNYKQGQDLIYLLQDAFPQHGLIIFGHDNERQEYVGETKYKDSAGAALFCNREDFLILSKYCKFFISIDSALQHMCSNQKFNKKGIVLWGSTIPKMFGYDSNVNLVSKYPGCTEIEPKLIVDEALKL